MHISLSSYTGRCSCGKEHSLITRQILIGQNAIDQLDGVLQNLGLPGNGCIICDSNTEVYAREAAKRIGTRLHRTTPIVALDPCGLHADEKAVAAVEAQLPVDTGWLLAVGSGTIHDTTRYIAHARGIHFVSFPTAASVDGFVSTVSAMTWHGFKKTMPGVAPLAVVADSAIFSKAPYRLTASGIADAVGKCTSLTDWQVGNLVLGEDFCPKIHSLLSEVVDNVMQNLEAIRSGEPEGCEKLIHALLLSGVAMQLWGNSRPASGAEHHISHMWEMELINPNIDALHGEKVGVGLFIVLELYEKIAAITDISKLLRSYHGLPHDLLREKFGALYESVVEENQPDLLAQVQPAHLVAQFEAIRKLLLALPDRAGLLAAMDSAGCKTTMAQLGLDEAILSDTLALSPFIRNRLTLVRLSKLFV